MATKSITNSIDIKKKPLAKQFVNALEHAENKSSKEVVLKKSCQVVHKSDVKKMFGASDDGIQDS